MGCFVAVISGVLFSVLFMIGFVYLCFGDIILGGGLITLSIIVFILGRRFMSRERVGYRKNYLEKYPECGFLHIDFRYARGRRVEVKVIEGPIANNEFVTTETTNTSQTYYLPVGEYKIEAKYYNTRTVVAQMETKIREPQILTFKADNKIFYELAYDISTNTFRLNETNPPKSLNVIFEMMK